LQRLDLAASYYAADFEAEIREAGAGNQPRMARVFNIGARAGENVALLDGDRILAWVAH